MIMIEWARQRVIQLDVKKDLINAEIALLREAILLHDAPAVPVCGASLEDMVRAIVIQQSIDNGPHAITPDVEEKFYGPLGLESPAVVAGMPKGPFCFKCKGAAAEGDDYQIFMCAECGQRVCNKCWPNHCENS